MRDNQVEALEQIKQMTGRIWITAREASKACGLSEQNIRWQAHHDPTKLGFAVEVAKSRVNIHRLSFIEAQEKTHAGQ